MQELNLILKQKRKLKNSLKVLNNIHIKDNYAEISDLDITYRVYHDSFKDLNGLIDFNALKNFKIKGISKNDTDYEINTDKGIIKENYLNENYLKYPKTDYGEFKEINFMYASDIPIIKKSAMYTAKNNYYTYRTCVLIEKDYIVALNDYIISYNKRDTKNKLIQNTFLIPESVTNYLDKKLGYIVYESPEFIKLKSLNIEIIYRKIQSQFENWQSLFPDYKNEFTISSDVLESIVSGCKYVDAPYFKLKADNFAEFSCQNISTGKVFSTKAAINPVPEISVGISCYLIELMMKAEKRKEYTFKIIDPLKLIKINNNIGIMPVMLQ